MMTGFGMGFGIIGLFYMIIFWGALIALAVWLVRSIFPIKTQSPSLPSDKNLNALEILDQRYALGEITREQYELMKQDIQ